MPTMRVGNLRGLAVRSGGQSQQAGDRTNPIEPIGNDYNMDQIEEWYRDEERFHDQFMNGLPGKSWYIYRVFDEGYAFDKYFHPEPDSRVLDFGCAEGCDIEVFHSRHTFRLYGLDASGIQLQRFSEKFRGSEIKKATSSGRIDFDNDFFDYIVELSALHHIPNVGFVLSELARVLKPNCLMIIREPVSFLRPIGKEPPKQGMSPRERGIPVRFMLREFEKLKLELLLLQYSFSTPVMFAVAKLPILERIPRLVLIADRLLSRALSLNVHYCRRSLLEKIAPGVAYYVVRKK